MKQQINIGNSVMDQDLNVGIVKALRKDEALVEFDEVTRFTRKLDELMLVELTESEKKEVKQDPFAINIGDSIKFNFVGRQHRGIVNEKQKNEMLLIIADDGVKHRRHVNDIIR